MGEGKAVHRAKDPLARWQDTAEEKAKYAELAGPKKEPTTIDMLLAGQLTSDQVAEEIFNRAYGSLARFYSIPTNYRKCRLGWKKMSFETLGPNHLDDLAASPPPEILDPSPAQLQAITFFQMLLAGDELVCVNKDPFQAKLGANFYGPAGTGKTHIMAAFGNLCAMALEQRLKQYRAQIENFVLREYARLLKNSAGLNDPNDTSARYVIAAEGAELVEQKPAAVIFTERLEELERKLAKLETQPTDLMYIGFDPLCELARDEALRKTLFGALEKAKLVFIDDVHPKGDPERAMIVQQIIERRYEQGRRGTIITTNLTPEELAGKDEQISKRLLSRCGEMLLNVDFTGSHDWRAKVNARRVNIVKEEIERRIAEHLPEKSLPDPA